MSSNDEVVGFVVDLSPVKKCGMNEYFNGVIQTGPDACKPIICFSEATHKHADFLSFMRDSSPIKLNRVRLVPMNGNPVVSEIFFTANSTIIHLACANTSLDFAVKKKQTNMSKIEDVPKMAEGFRPVAITAKVLQTVDDIDKPNVWTRTQRKTVLVTDNTGVMQLILWGDLISKVHIDHTYIFTNLTVRSYEMTLLTTTPNTFIIETTPIDDM